MKKCLLMILCAALLCGCGAQTFETVEDPYMQSVMQPQRSFSVAIEEGAEAVTGATGTIYLCDGYEVAVEVLSSGDLNGTLQTLTGYSRDMLTVMTSREAEMTRFSCVFTAAGENGDTVGRTVIFDDGTYHYCITVLSAAEDAQALIPAWNAIVGSVEFA